MQKKKNQYKTPEMEIVLFEQEDIITTSGESTEENLRTLILMNFRRYHKKTVEIGDSKKC